MSKKLVMKWIFLLIIISVACITFIVLCPDGVAKGTYHNPYSMAQVKKMMRFHGTLAAKFDGQAWWYKSGDQWIRLDNEQAKQHCI